MGMKIKRTIVYLIVMIMIAGVFGGLKSKDVYAEDVSIIISIEPMNIHVGDTVTATVTVSGDAITSFQIYLNYTSGVLEYQSGGETNGSIGISGTGATTMTYNFKAIAEGNASFTTTGYEVYGENGATLSVSHAGAVFAILGEGEEADEEDENTDEEEDDGTIKVNGEKYTLTYKDYFPAVPTDYTLSYVSYKGEDIYAYQSPNTGIKVVSLTNADYESKWFVYNEDDETFSPYIDYELTGNHYTIIEKPKDVELPAGYNESLLTLNDTTFVAYTDGTDSGLYLVYAVNQYGITGFYYYDTDEGSLTKYDTIKKFVDAEVSSATNAILAEQEEKAEQEDKVEETAESEVSDDAYSIIPVKKTEADDEDGLSKDMLKRILKTFIIVFVILCILMIILVIRNSNLQNRLLDYEDEEDNESFDEFLKKKSAESEQGAQGEQQTQDQQQAEEAVKELTAEERADIAAREKIEAEKAEKAKKKISRNKGYAVGEDTGEIQIEEAQDNNAGVNVPPASDKSKSTIEDAMKERPFGIDSAFDVVTMEEAPEGDHVLIESEENLAQTVNSETVERVWTEKNEELKNAEDESEAPTEILTSEPAINVMNKISAIKDKDKKTASPEKEPEKIVLPNFDEEEE